MGWLDAGVFSPNDARKLSDSGVDVRFIGLPGYKTAALCELMNEGVLTVKQVLKRARKALRFYQTGKKTQTGKALAVV